jgi:aryl-alcohol dehydrogenase-like predicted oxidoreductase
MKKVEIKHLNQQVSVIGLGTMIFHPDNKKDLAYRLLDAFVEHGGNLIDTAEIYGDPEEYGYSELTIGKWLSERKNRDQVIILTKGCIPGTCIPIHSSGSTISPDGIKNAITGSLKRLQTDYLDIWMLHRDETKVHVGEIIETLNEQVFAGNIRSFGASNWSVQRINEANLYAQAHGLKGFSCASPHFSLAVAKEPYWPDTVITVERDRAWYRTNQFPLFAWSSLGRGFFSRGSQEYSGDPELVRVFYSDDNFERLERARQLGARKGVNAIEIALAYVVNQDFPAIALMGPATVDELTTNINAAKIELTEKELNWLDLKSGTL